MESMVIINKKDNIYQEIFFNKDGNNYVVDGYNLIDNELFPISFNNIVFFRDILYPRNEMIFVGEYLNYTVYYDSENELKHFFYRGKEDFSLFLSQNGIDACLYQKNDSSINDKKDDRFFIRFRNGIIITSLSVVLIAAVLNIPSVKFSISDFYYQKISKLPKVTSCEQIVDYINNSSQMDNEHKAFLCNEQLFNDVLPCYSGTMMERLLARRLTDLSIEYYLPEQNIIALGYYSGDNTLHIRKGCDDSALGHEMAHLLQSPGCTYRFFNESVADIIQKEYYDNDYEGYAEQVYNLKLLMNTIGPDLVWNYVFSGDFSEIDSILHKYLSCQDYDKIIQIFKLDETDYQINDQLTTLIESLYYNMYGEDIYDNRDIFDYNYGLIDNVYFNSDKMSDYNITRYSLDSVPEGYVLNDESEVFASKSISLEEARHYMKDGYSVARKIVPAKANIMILDEENSWDGKKKLLISIDGKEVNISEKEALTYGFIQYTYHLIFDKQNNLNVQPDSYFSLPKRVDSNVEYEFIDGEVFIVVKTSTTKTRFASRNSFDSIKK